MSDKLTKNQNKQPNANTKGFGVNNSIQHIQYIYALPNELAQIAQNDPEFVKKYLKDEQTHRQAIETQIIEIERKEQELRVSETPHLRRFAVRGQYFGLVVVLFALGVSAYSLYVGANISVALGGVLVAAIGATPYLAGIFGIKKDSQKDKE